VLATPTLKDTFEHAVIFINQLIDEKHSLGEGNNRNTNSRNVSVTNSNRQNNRINQQQNRRSRLSGRNNCGKDHHSNHTQGKSNKKVTDHYYPYEEWKKFSSDEQEQAWEFRAECDKIHMEFKPLLLYPHNLFPNGFLRPQPQ
jgi:hypothetical protein